MSHLLDVNLLCDKRVPLIDFIEQRLVSDPVARRVLGMDSTTARELSTQALEQILIGHMMAICGEANQIFPSQFNRDHEDAPEPKGKAVAIAFDGPVQSLSSTLAVRLGHSGLFTTGRAEMWRNATVFTATAGGKCGLFLHEFAEGRGRLILFFPNEHASAETRFHFEEFVLAHARLSPARDIRE